MKSLYIFLCDIWGYYSIVRFWEMDRRKVIFCFLCGPRYLVQYAAYRNWLLWNPTPIPLATWSIFCRRCFQVVQFLESEFCIFIQFSLTFVPGCNPIDDNTVPAHEMVLYRTGGDEPQLNQRWRISLPLISVARLQCLAKIYRSLFFLLTEIS